MAPEVLDAGAHARETYVGNLSNGSDAIPKMWRAGYDEKVDVWSTGTLTVSGAAVPCPFPEWHLAHAMH